MKIKIENRVGPHGWRSESLTVDPAKRRSGWRIGPLVLQRLQAQFCGVPGCPCGGIFSRDTRITGVSGIAYCKWRQDDGSVLLQEQYVPLEVRMMRERRRQKERGEGAYRTGWHEATA